MTDRVVHTTDNSANTILIVIVLIVLVIVWFLFATGRLGNSAPQDTTSPTVNVDLDVPDGTTATNTTTTTTTE